MLCIAYSLLIVNDRQLLVAAKQSDVAKMDHLLRSGVDLNCRHPLGWSALHTAVINGSWKVIKFLVQRGADVNVRDEFSTANRVAYKQGMSSSRGQLCIVYCAVCLIAYGV